MSTATNNQEKEFSYLADVWKQFSKHKGAVVGMLIFATIIITTILGPFVWRVSPDAKDLRHRNEGPTMAHPFGTDNLGRDMLAANFAGGRISLSVGLIAMIISITIGSNSIPIILSMKEELRYTDLLSNCNRCQVLLMSRMNFS